MRRTISFFSIFILTLTGFTRAADNYKIDPIHAVVIYRISHLDLGNAYGRFKEPTGTISLDKEDASKSTFTFEVPIANLDTGNEKRDQHLRSPDFFNGKQFPTISFKSTSVAKEGDNGFKLTGDLNMHGIAKPISFVVVKTGEGKGLKPSEYRTGWEAQVDLKRSDWGIQGLQGPVGDDVHLIISFEAVKQ